MKEATLNQLRKTVTNFRELGEIIAHEAQDLYNAENLDDTIRHFRDVREAMDLVKQGRELLELIKDQLSADMIPDLMQRRKAKTITLTDVGRITVSGRFSVSVLEGMREASHEWLKANGGAALIQPTVNSSSLSAFAKELNEEQAIDLPDDIFKVGIRPYTSITKVAPKK